MSVGYSVDAVGPSPSRGASPKRLMSRLSLPGVDLARTSICAFLILVVSAGASCLTQIGAARIIGAESFGIFSYVLAWTTLLGYLATLGFHVSILRFVPIYIGEKQWPLLSGVIRFATWTSLAVGIAIVSIAMPVVLLAAGATSDLKLAFVIGLLTVPLVALRLVGAAAVRALGGVVTSLIPERIVRDSTLVVFLGLAYLTGLFPLDAKAASAAMLLSAVATLGLVAYFLRQTSPAEIRAPAKREYAARIWIKPAVALTFIMMADVLMSRSGVFALGLRGNTLDAGIFAAAYSMALLTSLPRMAVAGLFAPTVSGLHARGDRAALQALSVKATALSVVGATMIAVPLVLAAPMLLRWFGPGFGPGATPLAILVVGHVFAAAMGPQQHLITMTGHERAGATIMVTCAVASLLGALILSRPFGLNGAAIAVSASLIAWNVGMAWFISRKLGLRPGLSSGIMAAWHAARRHGRPTPLADASKRADR